MCVSLKREEEAADDSEVRSVQSKHQDPLSLAERREREIKGGREGGRDAYAHRHTHTKVKREMPAWLEEAAKVSGGERERERKRSERENERARERERIRACR